MTLDLLKIETADIMMRKYFVNSVAFGSILNYETYRGDAAGLPPYLNAEVLNYAGILLQREFYISQYHTPSAIESQDFTFQVKAKGNL